VAEPLAEALANGVAARERHDDDGESATTRRANSRLADPSTSGA
jgi:hypothetical protein